MYGEHIRIDLGNEMKVEVFVLCSPKTPKEAKEKKALMIVQKEINKRLNDNDIKYESIQSNFELLTEIS